MADYDSFEGIILGEDLENIIFLQLKTGRYGRFARTYRTEETPDELNGDWVKRAFNAVSRETKGRILLALEKAIIADDMKIRVEALMAFPINRIGSKRLMLVVMNNLDKFIEVRHEHDPQSRVTRGIEFAHSLVKHKSLDTIFLPEYFTALLEHPYFTSAIFPSVVQTTPEWLAAQADKYLGVAGNPDGHRWKIVFQECKDLTLLKTMIGNLKNLPIESAQKLRDAIQTFIVNDPYQEDLTALDAERQTLLALVDHKVDTSL